MKKVKVFSQVCEEIATERAYDRLQRYRSEKVWSAMAPGDRERLALLFIRKGQQQLAEGKTVGYRTIDLATKIAPNSAKVFYQQGIILGIEHSRLGVMEMACRSLEKAAELEKGRNPDTWNAWADALVKLGVGYNDVTYFKKADSNFSRAYTLYQRKKEGGAEFFWQWGLCWFYQGKRSGEAMDFKAAVDKFNKAAEKGLNKAVFWNDYGNALVELACLVGRYELLYDASQLYQRAVGACPDYFPGWLNFACCYQEIYEASGVEKFFALADETFAKAAEINADDVSLWVKRGGLHLNAGRLRNDVKRVKSSLIYFERADACEPDHSLALELWAEAFIVLGTYTEELEFLHKAEKKLIKCLVLAPEGANVWYLYGECLRQQGIYFGDDDYLFHSLSKLQVGLAKHPEDAKLFYGMALTYYAIGEQSSDPYMIHEALEHFAHHLTLGGGETPRFWNEWGVALMKTAELTQRKRYLEEAVDKFEYAITVQGGDRDTTLVEPELLYNYGCALDFLGDFSENETYYERSIQVLSQLIVLDPDYGHARYNLALAWSHLGELTVDVECFEKAIKYFQAIVNNDPEDEMAWNEWGLTLLNLCQLTDDPSSPHEAERLRQEVEHHLLQSVALGSTLAFYNLACYYSLIGDVAAAMHFLERARVAGVLPPIDDILQDEWLENLRAAESFRSFLTQIER